MDQVSVVTGQRSGSLIRGQGSLVKDHCQGSLDRVKVTGQWSRVTGKTIFYHQTLYKSDPAEGLEVMIFQKL